VAILEREPRPIASYAAATPAALESIVVKSLSKNRDERYQNADDLLTDLRGLGLQLEHNAIEVHQSRVDDSSKSVLDKGMPSESRRISDLWHTDRLGSLGMIALFLAGPLISIFADTSSIHGN